MSGQPGRKVLDGSMSVRQLIVAPTKVSCEISACLSERIQRSRARIAVMYKFCLMDTSTCGCPGASKNFQAPAGSRDGATRLSRRRGFLVIPVLSAGSCEHLNH